MLLILGYLLMGIVVIYGTAFVHVVYGEFKGYEVIKYWHEEHTLLEIYQPKNIPSILFGLLIWPIREAQFVLVVPELYNEYDQKE